jgi:glycosyltransferase involved in cell wall biosynthesis
VTTVSGPKRYLLVTHIPFVHESNGAVSVDGLWARDLHGLVQSIGPVRVAAPELAHDDAHQTWGPSAATLSPQDGVTFAGFPAMRSRRDLWRWPAVRRVLRREVEHADLVHTSNLFPPYLGLSYAHDLAVARGRKTLFVIAEDFHDMLEWEWVRMSRNGIERFRRARLVRRLEERVLRSTRTASLTFFHTPAAVVRYRLDARNGIAIRQPGHEIEDVIGAADFARRCAEVRAGGPLIVTAACRHKSLKGIDLLISAIGVLRGGGVPVEARIYGQGESTEAWKSLARQLGVADCVHFCGTLEPGPAVYAAIGKGHVFAMPHRTNDFGRAFYDALAAGVPIVAFRNAASSDTLRDGVDGFLAPPDDVEGLAAVLRRLHSDRQLLTCASQAARDRALHNTRSQWFQLRAGWIRCLFDDERADNHTEVEAA